VKIAQAFGNIFNTLASVSLDLLIRSLLTLGATVKELADIMVHSQDFAGNPN